MLGMAAIGIRFAIAGRWRGAARVWPLVAETWALVMFPAMALVSEETSTFVAAGHLLVGHTMLGVILVLRPELTGGSRVRLRPGARPELRRSGGAARAPPPTREAGYRRDHGGGDWRCDVP